MITKDMIIGEVVGMVPEATDIMLSYGLHCVGCHVNMYETIEQGMLGHGFTAQQMNDLIEELNDALEDRPAEEKQEKVIPADAENMKATVTDAAREKILTVAELEGKDDWCLRIKAKPGPGDKLRFAMDFEQDPADEDKVLTFEHDKKLIRLLLDKRDYFKLNGITVDYVITDKGEGFKITPVTD